MFIQPIPYRDPLAAFEIFARANRAVLLDGGAVRDGKSRTSYIASDPFSIIEATKKNGVTIDGKKTDLDPFTALERALRKYPMESGAAPAPFAGGAIGYLGYELGGWLECLPEPRRDALTLPTLSLGLYDVIAAYDHIERTAWIMSSGWPEQKPDERMRRAEQRARAFAERLAGTSERPPPLDWTVRNTWRAELDRADVERRIARIIDYIRAGDIFQANFSQRFLAAYPADLDPFMLYRRLRALSPAPFAAFLRCGPGLSVASASPERFLRLLPGGLAEAQPIKGTRPRDADPARDTTLAIELQNSVKDRAENLMIVDLMRNDLSRVCTLGSVHVPQLFTLESFASVHHLTSTVTGRLKAGAGPVDLLRASFPGGSVTGAPKIRAMEIIHELEPAPRGVYCGCLGWIGFDRTMDMSMMIRTLTLAGDTVLAQAGGGIVADSDPAAEYEESMTKIAPLLRALTGDGA